MAEAAELLTQTTLPEQLVEASYMPVDAIPELAAARLIGRREAYEVIEQNRQLLRDGNFEAVSIPVDALGTARRVAINRQLYGETSPEAAESFRGLELDSERLLAEGARKNTYEYFKPLRQVRNDKTGDYMSHGQSILIMTEKALTPVAEPEELDRRINEYIEEVTYKTIGGLALSEAVTVRTISECTDWAIKSLELNPKNSHGGYVPEIEKFMIRDVKFDSITRDRYEEQMGLSGKYITHEVITETLKRRGLKGDMSSKTKLQGTQMLVDDGLIEFVADLDRVASELHGQEIYLGEVLAAEQIRDYSRVCQEAEIRQHKLAPKPKELAEFIMGLELANTDEWLALGLVEARVKTILFDMVRVDHSLAAIVFDKATERGLQEVAYLQSIGQNSEAQSLLSKVENQAPAPGYCGAGSCGLESIGLGSDEAKKMKELGLDSQGALKDTERSCPCGQKKVVYDLKSGKKGCLACGKTAKL
jgi:hypothetical protein